MEVDIDQELDTTTPEVENLSELSSKVTDQGKLIENLRNQLEEQNQRLAKQEQIMRLIIQQVQSLHIVVGKDHAVLEIFKGMQFFITADGGGDPARGLPAGTCLPYPKDEYLCAIVKCGGQVIDIVGNEKTLTSLPTFLISDKPARTVKYIYCLAAGIPCLSYEWIQQCITQKQVVDWKPYRLKSGYSVERKTVIETHTEKPLKDVTVFIATDSDALYDYWKPVLVAAQASLLDHSKYTLVPPQGTELIITDGACRKELLEAAKRNRIPTVRPEWLVQTIILGAKADVARQDLYGVPDDTATESNSNEPTAV